MKVHLHSEQLTEDLGSHYKHVDYLPRLIRNNFPSFFQIRLSVEALICWNGLKRSEDCLVTWETGPGQLVYTYSSVVLISRQAFILFVGFLSKAYMLLIRRFA